MFTEETLAANLTALGHAQGQSPVVAPLDLESVRVVGTSKGPGLEIRTAQGHWVAMEGPQTSEFPKQLFVIGAALGALLESVENVGCPTRVVALEPDPGVAALLLARRDWRSLIDQGQLRVLVGPHYDGASSCACDVDVSSDPTVLVCPQLATHRPALVRPAEVVAQRIISEARSNANARQRFGGSYLLQTLGNLDLIGREADAAALDENVRELGQVRDRALLIAADTALRPLLAGGVKPHLVVAVDPAATNAAHIADVDGVDETFLVAEASLHRSAFSSFAGRTLLFKVSDHEPWPWLRTLGVERGVLRAWGSVLTSAFDLALRMGCDPIVFAGADLAYTDGRPYCRGTVFEGLWAEWHRRGSSWDHIWTLLTKPADAVTMNDLRGNPVRTAPHLIAFRNWLLEQMAATAGRRFINATGGGVLYGANVTQMTLEDALVGASAYNDVRESLSTAHAARRTVDLGPPARLLANALRRGAVNDWLARWVSFTGNAVAADEIAATLDQNVV